MTKKEFAYLSAAFLLCYLAIGIPYWQASYSSISLPDSLLDAGLLLTSFAALVFCARGTGFLSAATILAMSAPSVVMTRIIMDTMRDASTHNLWPFEIAIAIFIGFSIAGFGAMLGVLARKAFKPGAEKHGD